MSGGTTPPRVLSPLRLFATFCVLAPTVAVIAVPTYDSATPKLGGFPFFYWYQLLWVVLTGILMVAAYFAIRTDERQRRPFRTTSGPAPALPAPTASPEAAPSSGTATATGTGTGTHPGTGPDGADPGESPDPGESTESDESGESGESTDQDGEAGA
jgi:Protein of unknown function (DUF3311)